MQRRSLAAAAAAGLLLAGCGPDTGQVHEVIDGDTIEVDVDYSDYGVDNVRVVGIDTPELDACYGQEAAGWARGVLSGNTIKLEEPADPNQDPYGRRLAHVRLPNGSLYATHAVRRGYARVTIYPPNSRYADKLYAAQEEARDAGRGLWGECR